jgi:hypothetical protein
MGTQKQNPGGQPEPTAPGKPASRQPPDSNTGKRGNRDSKEKARDEGQDVPKTGRPPSESIRDGSG